MTKKKSIKRKRVLFLQLKFIVILKIGRNLIMSKQINQTNAFNAENRIKANNYKITSAKCNSYSIQSKKWEVKNL